MYVKREPLCSQLVAASALYPDVSLSMKTGPQRKARRKKRARRRSNSLLSPSHGPLRVVTSHSRFALASLRNHAKKEEPEEEAVAACIMKFFSHRLDACQNATIRLIAFFSLKALKISFNLVPRTLIDEAEGEIWSSKKIQFF